MSAVAHRIFVISDLHLGGDYPSEQDPGSRGFRICRQTQHLASFIRSLANQNGPRIELVINGDFVDFLAEEWDGETPWLPFIADSEHAAQRLSKMIERDQAVFESLKEFLDAGHTLTILLGNHDTELSLPAVRQVLTNAIDPGCGFRFIYDGEAYAIGSVLIEHGNRYDEWNVVDHDALRRIRSAQSRKERLQEDRTFSPPAGSLMVSSVMNRIKKRYQFVDLLKPEKEATLMLLLALAPEYRQHLLHVASLISKANSHKIDERGVHKFAGDVAAEYSPEPNDAIAALVSSRVGAIDAAVFLSSIAKSVPPPIRGLEEEISEKSVANILTLLPLMLASGRAPIKERLPALLAALRAFRQELSFDKSQEADEYLEPARRLFERGFKVVVFGHTHLAKKVQTQDAVYLNSGTWADLMRFPYERLDREDPESLLWLDRFAEQLDKNELSEYIFQAPTYAQIDIDGNGTVLSADVHEYRGSQHEI